MCQSSAPTPLTEPRFVQWHRGGTSVVLLIEPERIPSILHWGRALDGAGPLSRQELESLRSASQPQRVSGGIDVPAKLSLLPQESEGWQHAPGLQGHRAGLDFNPAFSLRKTQETQTRLIAESVDTTAGLWLRTEIELTGSGLLRQRHTVRNDGTGSYELQGLAASFPLPASATEVLDSTGRHLKERSPQRRPLTVGSHLREGRRGRPGADAPLLLAAGAAGFGFRYGTVHAVHLAWSGNYRLTAERTAEAVKLLSAAELLLPGEIRLEPGQSYTMPWAIGAWGEGLDEMSARFHQDLRARPNHPRSLRPVTLNSWEAVYFDHDLARLGNIIQAAAEVGVERFVLDDGWFGSRRDDSSGLGDWQVSAAAWPDGLAPLVELVRKAGMQFGLWFEPEMVNLDSELARQHPDWILHPADVEGMVRWPVSGRGQQVLNLDNPAAWQYLFDAISSLVTEHAIDYLKWDHNRDLLEPVDPMSGRPSVHRNTHGVYRLLAALKSRHPELEIESCASGGARVDLGILAHTDRIWASDCIDPLERLDNQAYTGLLVPYEMMGAHIGGPRSHSTRRTHCLDFRASSALFGHFGIEWDIAKASMEELAELAHWIRLHKKHRVLFHNGRSVHADLADPALDLRGVVAQDQSAAVFVLSQREASITAPSGPVTFPGLADSVCYSVRLLTPLHAENSPGQSPLPWSELPGLQLSGSALASVGLQWPVLFPENSVVVEMIAVER